MELFDLFVMPWQNSRDQVSVRHHGRSLSWDRLKREETRGSYFPPKTRAGRRTISIPALLVADLKRCAPQGALNLNRTLCSRRLKGSRFHWDWLLRVSPALAK